MTVYRLSDFFVPSSIYQLGEYEKSFCFNKTKKSGLLPPVELNGRKLTEAIV